VVSFTEVSPLKFYMHPSSPYNAISPTHLIRHYLIILIIFGEKYIPFPPPPKMQRNMSSKCLHNQECLIICLPFRWNCYWFFSRSVSAMHRLITALCTVPNTNALHLARRCVCHWTLPWCHLNITVDVVPPVSRSWVSFLLVLLLWSLILIILSLPWAIKCPANLLKPTI
jgi:hypothetical protein